MASLASRTLEAPTEMCAPVEGPIAMHWKFSADRLLTLLASTSATGPGQHATGGQRWTGTAELRPTPPPEPMPDGQALGVDDVWRRALAELVRLALVGDPDLLCDALTSDAAGWSPTGSFASRAEAEEQRREHATSLTVEQFTVDRLWWCDPIAFTEWRLVAIHNAPLLVADEVLIEASGHAVTLVGASLATIVGGRIALMHSYFDDAAIIEQVVGTQTPASHQATEEGSKDPIRQT